MVANPYSQVQQYKSYDVFEARRGLYQLGARNLLNMCPKVEGLIYDMGCGTGNATHEIFEILKKVV